MGLLEIAMDLLTELSEKFPKVVLEVLEKDAVTIVCRREGSLELISYLKEKGFKHLIDLCGVDYQGYKSEKKPERFEVVYHLYNLDEKKLIRVKVPIPENDAWQYSVTGLWKTANWFERECYDMFGIVFKGHPDLRRLLMPEDWEGYPLRKDYPLFLTEENEWKGYKEFLASVRGAK
jgi:NADH-quinone oxidoreductase subunit C